MLPSCSLNICTGLLMHSQACPLLGWTSSAESRSLPRTSHYPLECASRWNECSALAAVAGRKRTLPLTSLPSGSAAAVVCLMFAPQSSSSYSFFWTNFDAVLDPFMGSRLSSDFSPSSPCHWPVSRQKKYLTVCFRSLGFLLFAPFILLVFFPPSV